jgi:hypothetical protein
VFALSMPIQIVDGAESFCPVTTSIVTTEWLGVT